MDSTNVFCSWGIRCLKAGNSLRLTDICIRNITTYWRWHQGEVFKLWLSMTIIFVMGSFDLTTAQFLLDLDPSFNCNGKVQTNLALDPTFPFERAHSVAIQSDGKTLVAGTAYNGNNYFDFALVRYDRHGYLDPTFGTNGTTGLVTTDFGSTDDGIADVVIQSDGKIVVAGESGYSEIALARYNPDGSPDISFGINGNGRVKTNFGEYWVITAAALQPDDKLVVAGLRKPNPASDISDFVVARYLSDGTLDSNFGLNGVVITDFGMYDIGWDVDVQQDGKIVVVGSTWGSNFTPTYGALARYNTDGTPDLSFTGYENPYQCVLFGTCGKVITNFGGGYFQYGTSLALRRADGSEDGKIVIAGAFGVARYNPNGTLNPTFSGDGIMPNDPSDRNNGNAVAIRGDGYIVVAGRHISTGDFGVALYKSNGELEAVCSAGQVHTDFKGYIDEAFGIAIQGSIGGIVVAGIAHNNSDPDFAVARYKGGKCFGIPFWVPPPKILVSYSSSSQSMLQNTDYESQEFGESVHLVLPGTEGKNYEGGLYPAFQTYKINAVQDTNENRPKEVLISNSLGSSLFEVMEKNMLMVPSAISVAEWRDTAKSDTAPALSYKCFKIKESKQIEKQTGKRLTITDELNGTMVLELGKPLYLCTPTDLAGREIAEPINLVYYEAKLIKPKKRRMASIHTATRFGFGVVSIDKPVGIFLPSLVK